MKTLEHPLRAVSTDTAHSLHSTSDSTPRRGNYTAQETARPSRAAHLRPGHRSGGAFTAEQMADGAAAGAQALLAASVFHYNVATVANIKRSLHSLGVPVRNGDIRDSTALNTVPVIPIVSASSVPDAVASANQVSRWLKHTSATSIRSRLTPRKY